MLLGPAGGPEALRERWDAPFDQGPSTTGPDHLVQAYTPDPSEGGALPVGDLARPQHLVSSLSY